MKFLILAGKSPDTQSFSSGWFNALSLSHCVEAWNGLEAAFDCFDRFKPDVIWAHSQDLTRDFVRAAIDSQQKIILFLNDSKLATDKEKEYVGQIVKAGHTKLFSACFPNLIHTEEACWNGQFTEGQSARVLSCLPAADITRYKPVEFDSNHSSEISLISHYNNSRDKLLKEFAYPLLHDFDFKIYGYGNWPGVSYLGSLNKYAFNTVICSSKINLSISYEDSIFPSERIFKILACGKVPLIHRCNQEISDIFNWGYYFSNKFEMFERIGWMLNDPFSDVDNLLRFIKEKHTYEQRIHQVFEALEIK